MHDKHISCTIAIPLHMQTASFREGGLRSEGFSCIYIPDVETKVVKLDPANIDMGGIKEAAERIDAGALVAFPTETVYGIACRVKNDSLGKLEHLKGRSTEKRFTLHIARPNDVERYVPTVRLNLRKLIRNAWPGPLTIVFDLDGPDIDRLRQNLDENVFKSLYKDNCIGIRCPDHPVAAALLQETQHPVVAPSANSSGELPAVNGDQVFERLSGQVDMVLDAGSSQFGLNSTVVKMGKKGLEVLRPGVCSEEHLRRLSKIKFLFVCTGNTCRSPMAEGILKKYLAEKLHVHVDELDKIGYTVDSAGVIGSVGFPASPQAVVACAARGVDLEAHRNKGLTEKLIEESDFIYAMEPPHCKKVVAMVPDAASRCLLLEEKGRVPDPIGQPQGFYDRCAEQIERAVRKRMSELMI